MGRPRTFDVDEAVATATTLFWRGYDRTSLAELTTAIGIAPASFYFAFGGKEALFRLVVERYVAFQAEAFERAFQAPMTVACVRALLRGYAEVVTDPAHAPGCLVVNSDPSNQTDDGLRLWLATIREALRIRLRDHFDADRASGRLARDRDPEVMARLVATLAGGIAIEARAGATRPELHAMIDAALTCFDEGGT